MSQKTKNLCLTAVLMSMIFLVTRFIQIPIPLGYFNIGNSIIFICCTLTPIPYGVLAGAIGSALADLTSFPIYTIPTLIIKAVMPLIYYGCIKGIKGKNSHIIAALIASLIPLFGYTFTGCILYGGFSAGMAQFPGLFIEYIANMVVFICLYPAVKKLKKEM